MVRKEYMCLPLPSLFIYSWNHMCITTTNIWPSSYGNLRLDHSADSVNLPIINQSPSFDAASWNSSTNIVLSSILSHIWVILQKVAIFIFQIQKNKAVIGTSLLNSKHSNNTEESEKNMYFKKFNQYILTYVIIYDLVVLFVIPVTLLFFFVQKNPKR